MSRLKLPRYYIGTVQDHLDYAGAVPQPDGTMLTADGRALTSPGEYHGWSPDASFSPTSVMFYIMRGIGKPHPNWRAFPHLLETTPLQTHFSPPAGQPERRQNVAAALTNAAVPFTSTDTTFSFVMKLHAMMPVFEP